MLRQLQNTPLASRSWRLCNLYTIRDAFGQLVSFCPNESQREFYNRMWYCNDILKARKLGFSTFIEVIFCDDALFGSGLGVGIIDYTIEDAEAKLGILRTAWQHLDDGVLHPDTWKYGEILKKAVPLVEDSTRKLKFGNGSTARCSTSLRGSTPQRLHVSEMGKTAIWAPKKAREIINGAFNSMTPGNVRNMESTHEGGKLGDHYRLINISMRNDDANLSMLQSRFHFFPWYKDVRYVLHTGQKLRPEMVTYFERLERESGIVLSAQQKLWYDHKHLEQGHGMKKEFPSTPGECFEAVAEGAIYGTTMANLRANGQILKFGHHANLPFFTFWDIGVSDYTAVWLIQPVPVHGFLVLDWFEAEGLPGSAMPDQMRRWEAKYNKPIAAHYLPHDAETRAPGDGATYVQHLKTGGLHNIVVVPRTPDKWLGIGYVRDVLPRCWFHAVHCDTSRNRDGKAHDPDDTQEDFPSGVACLEGYARDTSPGNNLREMPKHDLFSHSADAFRTFGEAYRRGLLEHAQDAPPPKALGGPRSRR